ncbi:hypothetical protein MCC00300_08210 [Bifidobacterium longum subsp. longum]|nr:hypothetical protein BL105A_0171 [Bifidobacterium longum]GDY99695.1 hypothetical protein MCC01975_10270 [Bifidobacteriaceae bacterium MCC01975]GDZ29622.1 hypothetical protein MCC01978_01740 [Bifidobacteriaceae bacterium MCC01978]GDZ47579.1 hypothetical protein MCC01983_02500 [Bifidobacteriaceae bacterium MCC01983]GDZ54241.1 hypothetical protein MCC01979_10910 [Bifidobacteriaceae bacterium MCC01979]GDZ65918.1 hypothetical protein MCC01986_07800 [Bifidobacteriaceae bacterium MCC01986]GDZ7123
MQLFSYEISAAWAGGIGIDPRPCRKSVSCLQLWEETDELDGLRLHGRDLDSSLRLQLALLDEADHEQRDNRNGCDGLRH